MYDASYIVSVKCPFVCGTIHYAGRFRIVRYGDFNPNKHYRYQIKYKRKWYYCVFNPEGIITGDFIPTTKFKEGIVAYLIVELFMLQKTCVRDIRVREGKQGREIVKYYY